MAINYKDTWASFFGFVMKKRPKIKFKVIDFWRICITLPFLIFFVKWWESGRNLFFIMRWTTRKLWWLRTLVWLVFQIICYLDLNLFLKWNKYGIGFDYSKCVKLMLKPCLVYDSFSNYLFYKWCKTLNNIISLDDLWLIYFVVRLNSSISRSKTFISLTWSNDQ